MIAPEPSALDAELDRDLDLDWFSLAWYGQPVAALARGLDLVRIRPGLGADWLAALPIAASGHLALVSREAMQAGAKSPDVVVGGPCIGDCQAFPTLEALYDVATLVVTARALGAIAVVYLGDAEETLARGGDARFLKLAERFIEWVGGVAHALDWEQVKTVRTSMPAHEAAIGAIDPSLGAFTAADLGTAFHVGSGSVLVEDDVAMRVTRRTIAAHHPDVVRGHAGLAPSARVAVVENVQQAGCWGLARRSLSAADAERFSLLATWPAPSASGTDRMYRAGSFEKVPATELRAVAAGARPGTSERTTRFFAGWLDDSTRAELAGR